jgi:murein DD-endopeptidase MepM/ murein hydrolase activator NlpD
MRGLLLILSLALTGIAGAIELPTANPVPGGVALIPLTGGDDPAPEVYFGKRRVLVMPGEAGWTAVVGIPLSQATGSHDISVKLASGATERRPFEVGSKEYPTQRLTIANRRKVEPTAEDMKRIARERRVTREALRSWTEQVPDLGFIAPVDGRRSSSFGLRRILNGQPRSPHKGMDIAAPEGTPIRLPAAGTVLHVGDFFFSGNVVYVDHGLGVVTLYAHLSEIHVRAGQRLEKGEVIGSVGMTGRVTGPHLHWSVYLSGIAVDPALFL